MSLDVYLTLRGVQSLSRQAIFIREDGSMKEISRAEWDQRFPNCEPFVAQINASEDNEVFSANITHNLNKMASAVGIYEHLWRPEEISITHARQLIEPLQDGLAILISDPDQFKQFNPSNGWGDYDGFVRFVREYLAACETWPDAEVSVSR